MFGCGMMWREAAPAACWCFRPTATCAPFCRVWCSLVTAQAAYRGLLSPAREWVTNLWLVDGGPSRDIMAWWAPGRPKSLPSERCG